MVRLTVKIMNELSKIYVKHADNSYNYLIHLQMDRSCET